MRYHVFVIQDLEPDSSVRAANLRVAAEYCADVFCNRDIKQRTFKQEKLACARAPDTSNHGAPLAPAVVAALRQPQQFDFAYGSDDEDSDGPTDATDTALKSPVSLVGSKAEEEAKQVARRKAAVKEARILTSVYSELLIRLMPAGKYWLHACESMQQNMPDL